MAVDPYPVHPASHTEFQKAIKIRIRVFVDIQKFPLNEEVDEYDKSATHLVIVDAAKDDVIGTLRIIDTGKDAKMGRIVILPEYQGRGLGRKLVSYAEYFVAHDPKFKHCLQVKLGSQYDKRVFYEKCGYEPRGDIYDELGCPHIWMYKAIVRQNQ